MNTTAIRLLLAMTLGAAVLHPGVCPDVSEADKSRVVHYIAKRYRLPATANLSVESAEPMGDQCYRKLTLRGEGALGTFRITLYLSPDLRFLSTDLFDSRTDPDIEAREAARKTMGELMEGEYASRGSPSAPQTLVIFSDFECPYCKAMADLMAGDPLLKDGRQIRVIFRHMPMTQHPWAQAAAEATACAQFQSERAFWALHDGVFAAQRRISAENAASVLAKLASRIPDLDQSRYRECMKRDMALGVVVRDRALGMRLGVQGTPTLFLNGEKLPGVRDAAQLHRVLSDALARSPKSDALVKPAKKPSS